MSNILNPDLNEQEHNNAIQLQINEKMLDPYFQDMFSVVGREVTEFAALVDVLRGQLEEKLAQLPTFDVDMAVLKARRM